MGGRYLEKTVKKTRKEQCELKQREKKTGKKHREETKRCGAKLTKKIQVN